jgi:hypothetical protein
MWQSDRPLPQLTPGFPSRSAFFSSALRLIGLASCQRHARDARYLMIRGLIERATGATS